MRDECDFANASKDPYACQLKKQVTIQNKKMFFAPPINIVTRLISGFAIYGDPRSAQAPLASPSRVA